MASVHAYEQADGSLAFKFPYSQYVVSELKIIIPSSYREWNPAEKMWIIQKMFVRDAIRILEDAFGKIDFHEYEGPTYKRQEHVHDPPPRSHTFEQVYADLHLRMTAPKELIHGAYKILAKLYHPDMGGKTSDMERINAAYDRLKDKD